MREKAIKKEDDCYSKAKIPSSGVLPSFSKQHIFAKSIWICCTIFTYHSVTSLQLPLTFPNWFALAKSGESFAWNSLWADGEKNQWTNLIWLTGKGNQNRCSNWLHVGLFLPRLSLAEAGITLTSYTLFLSGENSYPFTCIFPQKHLNMGDIRMRPMIELMKRVCWCSRMELERYFPCTKLIRLTHLVHNDISCKLGLLVSR